MKALRLFWAALREIFDEAPYERFLAAHHLSPSQDSYRSFLADRRASQERKPRCC